ncbi:MAG: tetratricopeptide repeat protein, partial [Deltaproteobacteria bacterium]|nr:tetratricopeptide repeat protein [Deltaproteobacteria bacterium]
GLKWAFTTSHASNWHPLTWLSHMLDVQLFGMRPGWHHLMNLFFHVANTLLLFLILHRMTKAIWQSAFVAALFALHPLHVESVAWIAERKDVLSTTFWILTMGAYVHYVEQPRLSRYLLIMILFILGLMAKPMLVTLPFVLLLMDFWPLGRFYVEKQREAGGVLTAPPENRKRKKKKTNESQKKGITGAGEPETQEIRWSVLRPLIVEKIPLLVLSAVSSIITLYVQQIKGAISSLQLLSLDTRIENSLVSYVSYIGKMIWPQNLAVFYPHPGMLPPWQVLGAGAILAGITFITIGNIKRFPPVTVGWLWYLGTLVPVIGLVQVGMQAMADRYTYIPFVGLFIIVAWGVPGLLQKWQRRKAIIVLSASTTLIALIVSTSLQLHHWHDSITLFTRAIDVTRHNAIAHYNLGTAMTSRGNLDKAILHYTEAIRINPNDEKAYNNMGNALFKQGKKKESIANLREALRINPDYADAHYNLGTIMSSEGNIREAIFHLMESLRVKPDYGEAHFNLANIFISQNMISKAVTHYAEAIRINPDDEKAHNNMGNALRTQGRLSEAIAHYQNALRIRPDYKIARDNLRDVLTLQHKKR